MCFYDEVIIEEIKNSINIEDYISQYIDLEQRSGKLFGICPFHEEKTASLMVDIDKKMFHCFGCKVGGSIIDFVKNIDNISYYEAIVKLSAYSGVSLETRLQSETLKIFKQMNKTQTAEVPNPHFIYDYSIYDKFNKGKINSWIDEGISQNMIDLYDIRIDVSGERIVYPVYDINNNLINIKGRTLREDFKKSKIPKYINYYKVGTMDYLQCLNMELDNIKINNEVIIFEGIKSCMKAKMYGVHAPISAETSALNIHQIKLLLSLKCNIVVAFDKDKPINDIKKNIKILSKFTNVFIINDKNGLLGDKSNKLSPVDAGQDVWEELYKNKERM